jgi:WS/DGAT/MGAT family acyltransferase
MHHSVVDGIAGTDLLSLMLDDAPDAEPGTPGEWMPTPEPSGFEVARFGVAAMLESLRAHARHFVAMLLQPVRTWRRIRDIATGAKGLWFQPRRPVSPLTGPIGARRRWIHTQMSLDDVATIRHAIGGTVNDVVLAAVAQGFRELLSARGAPCEGRDVMALVPMSMRTASERGLLDNRVAVAHALLPVGIADPAGTLAAVCAHLAELKVSHQTDASTLLLHTGDVVPHALASAVARGVVRAQQNLETIATNVPGPRQPMYLCGRRMLEGYPFAPLAGRIRIAVAIWSYCGTLFIGVTGDRETTGDLDMFVAGIDAGFRRLVVASVEASGVE